MPKVFKNPGELVKSEFNEGETKKAPSYTKSPNYNKNFNIEKYGKYFLDDGTLNPEFEDEYFEVASGEDPTSDWLQKGKKNDLGSVTNPKKPQTFRPNVDVAYARNLYEIMKNKGLDANTIIDVFKTSGLNDDEISLLTGGND